MDTNAVASGIARDKLADVTTRMQNDEWTICIVTPCLCMTGAIYAQWPRAQYKIALGNHNRHMLEFRNIVARQKTRHELRTRRRTIWRNTRALGTPEIIPMPGGTISPMRATSKARELDSVLCKYFRNAVPTFEFVGVIYILVSFKLPPNVPQQVELKVSSLR